MLKIKIATREEAEQGFKLMVPKYQGMGYIPHDDHSVQLRHTEYLAKLDSMEKGQDGWVLVAKDDNKVVGTVMVEFGTRKLCIEELFPETLRLLRSVGTKFVYFGSFAIADDYNCTMLSMQMIQELDSLLRGAQIGLCVVSRKHQRRYERCGFVFVARKDNMTGYQEAEANLMSIRACDLQGRARKKVA